MSRLYSLNPIDVRILACLIEKALTTPDQYPLTENSLRLACNQKSNRDPVMNLQTGEILHSLRDMESDGWVRTEHGARAERYAHHIGKKLGINRAQMALICVLCLRGSQTLSELKTRTQRMCDENAMLEALSELMQRETPLIEEQEKQPGQREERYHQLLFDLPETASKSSSSKAATVTVQNLDEERLEKLEAMVEELTARIEALENQQN